ncbi:MAG: hypothetical protein EHM49_01005 [Deltaproteobacteria bacterium]|nr:MAG: hypothetical protein EHM49_01005 [Deltaproteobacteria bacterium]
MALVPERTDIIPDGVSGRAGRTRETPFDPANPVKDDAYYERAYDYADFTQEEKDALRSSLRRAAQEKFSGSFKEWNKILAKIDKQVEAEAQRRSGMRTGILEDETKTLLTRSLTEEEKLKQSLSEKTQEATTAVDNLLSSLMDQTGYVAGLTKQATATNLAGRGILRSGQTTDKLQGIDTALIANRRTLQGQRNEQVAKIEQAQGTAVEAVADRRTEIKNQLKQAEISGLKDLAYQESVMKQKMALEQFINDLGISSENTKALLAGIGSLAKLGGIAAGYKLGATPKKETDDSWGDFDEEDVWI